MKTVLQFSGGLDSLACLHLMQDTPDMIVLTVSTDGAYPERAAYLHEVAERFPQLTFVRRHTERELPTYGQPVDVVPLRYTAMGQFVRGKKEVRYQDFFSCCQRAIWMPMHRATLELGAQVIVRGQRDDDEMRAPVEDGTIIDGITYCLPIADWSKERVRSYVLEHMADLIPPSYLQGEKTSRDCWDCTAYLRDNAVRITNLSPSKGRRINAILTQWREDVATEMETLT